MAKFVVLEGYSGLKGAKRLRRRKHRHSPKQKHEKQALRSAAKTCLRKSAHSLKAFNKCVRREIKKKC